MRSFTKGEVAGSRSVAPMVNVMLMGAIMSLLVLVLIGFTAKQASSQVAYPYKLKITSAVVNNSTVYWNGPPRGYGDAVTTAVRDWGSVGPIRFVKRGADRSTLLYRRAPGNPTEGDLTTVARFVYTFAGADVIYFYPYLNNKGVAEKRLNARHETGHALGLAHPVEIVQSSTGVTQNRAALIGARRCCVMHTYYKMGESVTTLTAYDRNYLRWRW